MIIIVNYLNKFNLKLDASINGDEMKITYARNATINTNLNRRRLGKRRMN